MPNYNTQNPPNSLFPGDVGWCFGVRSIAAIAASPGGLSNTGGTVTVSTGTAHGFKPGQYVTLTGTTSASGFVYDREYLIITVPSSTTFTVKTSLHTSADTGGGGLASSIAGESPTAGQASQQFALGSVYDGAAGSPSEVRVDISYSSAPSAVSVSVQSAIDDADPNYVTEYTATATAGESVKLTALRTRFIRAVLNSQTGGGVVFVRIER